MKDDKYKSALLETLRSVAVKAIGFIILFVFLKYISGISV